MYYNNIDGIRTCHRQLATAPYYVKSAFNTLNELNIPKKGVVISQVYHIINVTTMENGQNFYPALEWYHRFQKFLGALRERIITIVGW